ncbi:MAG TPA: hypothetical protein VES42_23740 [Pilimelia sp.]|nr:hypothetical protein [Pilimelia sp.]
MPARRTSTVLVALVATAVPAGPLEIELSAGLHDVSSGYVVIAPMAELHP